MGAPEPLSSCPSCKAGVDAEARYCGTCGAAILPTQGASAQQQQAQSNSPIGQEIAGRYRILAKLGEGGMGAVYRAEQISLKRRVALKVLKPELSAEPGLVRRFNAEAELAAKLNHPNTVTLYDFGQDEAGALFIAMEFIEGRSLRQELVRGGPLPPARIVAVCTQICSSLADAHAVGIVHRDLKPDNVMLSERGRKIDIVSVLDFGIAKLRDDGGDITQQPMTRAGDLLGTPQYMAPEQIRGETVDARTDIYALGVMLYEMVTARLPFEGKTVMALLSKHLTDVAIPPSQRRPDLVVPAALEQLIMHCLAKDKEQRPATMEQVEQALIALHPTAATTLAPASQVSTAPHSAPGVPMALGQAPTGFAPQSSAPVLRTDLGSLPGSAGHPATAAPTPIAAQQRTPVPNMHSAPGMQSAPARRSRTWLWVLLVLLLLGAGGAGAYFALLPADTKEQEGSSDEFDMSNWENDKSSSALEVDTRAETDSVAEADSEAEAPELDSEDQIAEALKELENTSAELEDVLGQLPGNATLNSGANQTYVDTAFGYSLQMPSTFIGRGDGLGNATFAGMVGGHAISIMSAAWSEPGNFDEDEIEAALQVRLSLLGLETLESRWTNANKRRALRGKVRSSSDGQVADFILLRRARVFFLAAAGGSPASYRGTKDFRESFFAQSFGTR